MITLTKDKHKGEPIIKIVVDNINATVPTSIVEEWLNSDKKKLEV